MIDNEELQDSAFIMGKIPNEQVPNVLNELDVFCAISNNESFGVAVVEAMACEIPVIASNVDGFCEVMEDGKTGILVPKEDVNSIVKALKKVISDEELRKEYGKNGRDRVLKYYNWKNNVYTMKQTYESIMNNKEIGDIKDD